MRKLYFTILLSAIFLLAGFSKANAVTNNGFPYSWIDASNGYGFPYSGYKLLWEEQFNDLSLAPNGGNARWFAPIHSQLGIGKMAQPGSPGISVENGNLVLKTGYQNGVWTDTNVQTMDAKGRGMALQNGYIEARIKLPEDHGSHAGFWLLSMNDAQKGHGEIDVVESYGRQDAKGLHSTSHWWPGAQTVPPVHVYVSNYISKTYLQGSYHKFGAWLTDEWIVLYYDGVVLSKIKRLPQQRVPFYAVLSLFTDPNRTDGYEPATMKVDYVRFYVAK